MIDTTNHCELCESMGKKMEAAEAKLKQLEPFISHMWDCHEWNGTSAETPEDGCCTCGLQAVKARLESC